MKPCSEKRLCGKKRPRRGDLGEDYVLLAELALFGGR